MTFSKLCRPWFGLVAITGLLAGCGANPDDNLPPQTPATESDVMSAEQQIQDNMGQMGPSGN